MVGRGGSLSPLVLSHLRKGVPEGTPGMALRRVTSQWPPGREGRGETTSWRGSALTARDGVPSVVFSCGNGGPVSCLWRCVVSKVGQETVLTGWQVPHKRKVWSVATLPRAPVASPGGLSPGHAPALGGGRPWLLTPRKHSSQCSGRPQGSWPAHSCDGPGGGDAGLCRAPSPCQGLAAVRPFVYVLSFSVR